MGRQTPTTQELRFLAAGAHAGQTYGTEPYTAHLEQVVEVVREFEFHHLTSTIQIAWLHDIVEDTGVTPELLADLGVDKFTIWAVEFLTDEDGPNRKTKKFNTYERVRQTKERKPRGAWLEQALTVKWADRIANIRMATANSPELLKMYRREAQAFREVYLPDEISLKIDRRWQIMVAEYDRLVAL